MKMVLKTCKGYLNLENGIKVVKDKAKATAMNISSVSETKDRIYKEKPMIGHITTEKC